MSDKIRIWGFENGAQPVQFDYTVWVRANFSGDINRLPDLLRDISFFPATHTKHQVVYQGHYQLDDDLLLMKIKIHPRSDEHPDDDLTLSFDIQNQP